MKKFFFIILSWAFYSCSSNESEKSIQSINDNISICTFDQTNIKTKNSSKTTSAIITWPRWETGKIIKIKFLDGNEIQQQKVKDIASEWLIYANLQFEYVSTGYADIRIGFERSGELGENHFGAWSELGMESAYGTNMERQTMRLGPLTAANESANKRTVLHEFGHALGLIHEHTSPVAKINWDFPKVYKYYYDTMRWSKEQVDEWVIKSPRSTNYSEYDPLSIMHYYVDPALTTDGKGVNEMNELSSIDKKSITTWYPFISTLKAGEVTNLTLRQLRSPNGRYSIVLMPNGFYCYDNIKKGVLWNIVAFNASLYRNPTFSLLPNGNFVIEAKKIGEPSPSIVWSSNTAMYNGAILSLQDSGQLLLLWEYTVAWNAKSDPKNIF